MNKRSVSLLMVSMIVVSGQAFASQIEEGKDLFRQYGCITCHGEAAKDPASEIIPVLAGRSQEYVYNKAKKILSGEGETRGAKIMHSHFYASEQCDAVPPDEVLAAIAAYVSSVPKP